MKNKKIRILNRFVITIIISVFVFACNTPNDVPNPEVVGVSKEHISLDDAKSIAQHFNFDFNYVILI